MLARLLKREYGGEFSVILVDDHSQDSTAQRAHQAIRELDAESRTNIRSAAPLPAGWTGKVWALNEGVSQAASAAPTYFWFTDADIVHAPDTLQRLVARAERDHLYLTSLMVLLQAKTLPERALIPAFLFFFLKLYPPRWIANPRARTAGAAGGCSGGRLWMGLTRASVSLRAYSTFREIRDLIARTAFTQLRYSALLLLGTLLAMLLTYLAPVALLFVPHPAPRILGACAWLIMSVLYLPTIRFYRLSPAWATTLALSALFCSYATCLSAARYYLGRGAQWKGRAQASPTIRSS